MSFNEMSDAARNFGQSESPILGRSAIAPTVNIDDPTKPRIKTMVRYLVANTCDDGDRATLEDLMTRSLSCAGTLSTPGDVLVVREDHTFDRQGDYQVAIKYYEAVKDTSPLPKPTPGQSFRSEVFIDPIDMAQEIARARSQAQTEAQAAPVATNLDASTAEDFLVSTDLNMEIGLPPHDY